MDEARSGDELVGWLDDGTASHDGSAPAAGTATAPARRHDEWLGILTRVTEGALAHLDLKELLHDLLDGVREAMRVDSAAVLLLPDDGQDLLVYSARGPEERAEGIVRVPIGHGVAETVAATAKPLVVDDLSKVPVENPLPGETARSLVGVPILVGDRVIGVLHVGSARLRRFTAEDAQLLSVIADRVAMAVEHARLAESERAAHREAEAAMRQLRTLQEVSDEALAHVRLNELLRSLLARIQVTMEVDNVAILLPVPDQSALTLYSVRGPEEAVMGIARIPMGEGIAGTIAATRRPLIVENLKTVPMANPFLKEHFTSLLGIPLLVGDRLIGVLHVGQHHPAALQRRRAAAIGDHRGADRTCH